METSTRIPADGPDAVLMRLAHLLELPQDEIQIRHTVASHPRPTSLLALVDVGSQFGLELKPAKCNEAALEQQSLPVVAHFSPADGRQGGFGVIEGISEDSIDVWDSAGGLRTVARSELLERWSGVLVPVDVVEDRVSQKPPAPWRRALGRIVDRSEAPTLADGYLRLALAALILLSLVLSISSYPSADRIPLLVITALAIAGSAIGTLMTVAVADYAGPFAPGICRRGRLVDCQSVLTSRFAKVFGFPLSEIGIAFYAAIVLTVTIGGGRPEAISVVALALFTTVPAALALVAVQISMRRLCTLCLTIHAVNLVGAGVAAAAWPGEIGSGDLVFMALLFVSFFSLVLLVGIPYWRDKKALDRLARTHGRMFTSPLASLAQLVTEQPTGLNGAEHGIEIGGPRTADELVAFVHPSCGQCEPVLREASSLAAAGRVRAYIAVPPRDAGERPLCRALVAIALSHGPEALARAYRVAKNRFTELAAVDDPLPILTEELAKVDAPLAPDRIEAAMSEAESVVRRAEAFAVDHVEGTPSVFLNSFPYRGPMAHLVPLLTDHAEHIPRERVEEVRL